jgi:hypothetical protein
MSSTNHDPADRSDDSDGLEEWDDDEDEVLTRFLQHAVWFSVLWAPHTGSNPFTRTPCPENGLWPC